MLQLHLRQLSLWLHGRRVWSDLCKQFWHWKWDQPGKVTHSAVGVQSWKPGEYLVGCDKMSPRS